MSEQNEDVELENLFGQDDLPMPTMRGSANLDPQDYARFPGGASSILDDDLQEDTRSTPGSGAGPATDIDGLEDLNVISPENGPGMEQTTYGSSPWGPGSVQGYRPHSQARTDMNLGNEDLEQQSATRAPYQDSMHYEPEVQTPRRDLQLNAQPSNEGIDPETIYDRTSYEFNRDGNNIIGNGIFDNEEGTVWRSRDGIFANDYAQPAYLVNDPELGVQQSEMWDPIAQNWRVTQPSAGGVTLKTRVDAYKPGPPGRVYTPFMDGAPPPDMRMETTGPTSHVEAFSRKTAAAIVSEATTLQSQEQRSRFLTNAMEALGPGMSARCNAVAAKLVKLGYRPDQALVDTMAHCVMHATAHDLGARRAKRGRLSRLDTLSKRLNRSRPAVQQAAAQHLGPLTKSEAALKSDLGALYNARAAGMGQVAEGTSTAIATTGSSSNVTRNLLIAGGVGLVGYLAWANRKSLMRNARRLNRRAARAMRLVTGG